MLKRIKSVFAQVYRAYVREFRLVLHDFGIILFFTFLPLAYPVIYSLIYNPELVRDVPMVVVDHDRSSMSRELARNMDASQEAWVIGYAADLNEAKRAMDDHKAYGILEIPEGFGRNIGVGKTANAVMYCDMSLLLRYRGFLVAATNVAQEMGAEIQSRKIDEVAPLAATISQGDLMPINNISMGNIRNGFNSFIMPGIVVLILHQCIVLACGMAGGAKREKAFKLGHNPHEEQPSVAAGMIGQMLCYFTILFLPAIWLFYYIPLIFAFPQAGNFIEIMAYLLPMVIGAMAIGFCLQGVVYERETVFILWVATSVALVFLSGITWPRYAMSGPWKFLSDILPSTWGVEGFIKMNTNGSTLAQLRGEYLMEWILAAFYMVCAYIVQKFVVRPDIDTRMRLARKMQPK